MSEAILEGLEIATNGLLTRFGSKYRRFLNQDLNKVHHCGFKAIDMKGSDAN